MISRNRAGIGSTAGNATRVLAILLACGGSPGGGSPAAQLDLPGSRFVRCRRFALLVVACGLLAGSALVTGCGSPSSGPSITLYSGQHEQTTDGLVSAFEKQTGITVNVRSDDEDTLANLIALQGSRSPADVFYTENSPALEFLQEKGLLAPVDTSTLSRVAARYSSPQQDWVGVSARVSVLIYNPSLIARSQLPTSVMQLADPRYQGKVAFAAGETDFQPIVTSVIRTYGQAAALRWLDGIKANAASHIVPDNETITDEVNRGQVAFGVINQYYWYRLRAEIGASAMHSQITYFAPHDPGYVLDVSGAAVLKSSKHQAAAQEFLAFLVSKQGQEIIARAAGNEQSYEYPLASGVTTSAPETPFNQLQPNPITIADLGDGSAAINLLRQAGLL
jgi:iron(III) transport system substrate-binding protein